MTNPELSIIVAVYNGQLTIRQCLESILRQPLENFEIIVVDNNSTDRSKEIITEFSAKGLVEYIFEKQVGRGAARQAGISVARGKIIVTIDADCVALENWLAKIIAPIVNGQEKICLGAITETNKNYWSRLAFKDDQLYLNRQLDHQGRVNHLATGNLAIEAALIKQLGFDRNLVYFEDFDLLMRLPKGTSIKFCPEAEVYHQRQGGFWAVIKSQFCRAFWLHRIFLKNRPANTTQYQMLESLTLSNWLKFPVWLVIKTFQSPLTEWPYFIVTQLSWRAGILWGVIKK